MARENKMIFCMIVLMGICITVMWAGNNEIESKARYVYTTSNSGYSNSKDINRKITTNYITVPKRINLD